MFNRCRKGLRQNSACLHDKSPRQSRTGENISQDNIILQTNSQHPKWGKPLEGQQVLSVLHSPLLLPFIVSNADSLSYPCVLCGPAISPVGVLPRLLCLLLGLSLLQFVIRENFTWNNNH